MELGAVARDILFALDTLAVALADEGHTWSNGERGRYEDAVAALLPLVESDREHLISTNCWCQPRVETVPSAG